jgi:hypothetical protein
LATENGNGNGHGLKTPVIKILLPVLAALIIGLFGDMYTRMIEQERVLKALKREVYVTERQRLRVVARHLAGERAMMEARMERFSRRKKEIPEYYLERRRFLEQEQKFVSEQLENYVEEHKHMGGD